MKGFKKSGGGMRGFGGGGFAWKTRTQFGSGGQQFVRPFPQHNHKAPDGTHTFYDPNTQRSGVAGPDADRKRRG